MICSCLFKIQTLAFFDISNTLVIINEYTITTKNEATLPTLQTPLLDPLPRASVEQRWQYKPCTRYVYRQICVHHVIYNTQLDLVLYIVYMCISLYIYQYIVALTWCKRWNLIPQVWEPSISTKISVVCCHQFPFWVPEANLGTVVVGHRQTPPGSWFHAILHLLSFSVISGVPNLSI